MNIQTREEFDYALRRMAEHTTWVVDTETNGLDPYHGNCIISISVYLPDIDEGFNFPFRHGFGEVEIRWNESNPEGTPFQEMNWSGYAKSDAYLKHWIEQVSLIDDYGNLPEEWMEDLREVWKHCELMIFHNARFDLNMLLADNFPMPPKVEDTMIALHIVHEDWGALTLKAPYRWTEKDAPRLQDIGKWAVDSDGNFLRKEQRASRQLKWQAMLHGFEGAHIGEDELAEAIANFEDHLVNAILEYPDDPMNAEMVVDGSRTTNAKLLEVLIAHHQAENYLYEIDHLQDNIANPPDGTTKTYWRTKLRELREEIKAKATPIRDAKLFYDNVRKAISVDSKAHMWMLPSHMVAQYAVLDVKLTWKLREWCLRTIEAWDNLDLYEIENAVAYELAWRMEVNGCYIDREKARAVIADFDQKMESIRELLQPLVSDEWNINSQPDALALLNSGILAEDWTYGWPDWWPEGEARAGLRTYEKRKLYNPKERDKAKRWTEGWMLSTDKETLQRFGDHALVRLLQSYRQMRMSNRTYLEKWVRVADATDRVHFSVWTDGTATGRMASSGQAGNAQNIPDRGGYRVKEAIVAPEDWVLVAYDYDQLELKLACWYAEVVLGYGNMEMTSLFRQGVDVHAHTRDMLNVVDILFEGMTLEQILVHLGYESDDERGWSLVEREGRQKSKTMNFGLLYNGTEYMMAKALKTDLARAEKLTQLWRHQYPAFMKAQEHYVSESGLVRPRPDKKNVGKYVTQLISGRHRKLHKLPTAVPYLDQWSGKWKYHNVQEATQDKCWNSQVQGLGGYICKVSGLNTVREFDESKLRWFVNIHDALDGYAHKEHLNIMPRVQEIMTDWEVDPALTVTLEASPTGTWQDMREVKDMDLWITTQGEQGYE